jgi:membrane AbrB-like protein
MAVEGMLPMGRSEERDLRQSAAEGYQSLLAWFWHIVLAYLIGSAGSLSFLSLKLPLPWFLGSLTFCLIAAVSNIWFERPRPLAIPVRAVLGVAIGTAFTPALLSRAGGMLGSLALLVPWMLAIIGLGVPFFERLARFDRVTAFFSAIPGGLTDMVTMAADSGANTRTVTLVQASRILLIVFALPLWLQGQCGYLIGGPLFAGRLHIGELTILDAVVLISLGWAGWWGATRLGLAGAAIVGPMIVSGLFHTLGVTSAKVPFEFVTFSQITLGIMLGGQFRGLTWREFSNTMVWGIAFAMALLAATALMTLVVARLMGINGAAVLLAFAPGGQTELNLIAFVLGLDVAYVALHHLVRLAIVILGSQVVVPHVRR